MKAKAILLLAFTLAACRPTIKPDMRVSQRACQVENRLYRELFDSKRERRGFECAFYDLEEGLFYAEKWNKPIFLHFTGHTCYSGPSTIQGIFRDDRPANFIADWFVVIELYVDDASRLPEPMEIGGKTVTRLGQKNFQLQKLLYSTIAQPYWCIIDWDLRNMVRPRGFDPDVSAFMDFLGEGKLVFEGLHGK